MRRRRREEEEEERDLINDLKRWRSSLIITSLRTVGRLGFSGFPLD